jgi:D-3-phosphoglycerate dehydrogenase / 2-oxoglutarate reductase
MKILIADAFDKSLKQKLEKFGEVMEDKSRLSEANVVLVRSATKCTKEYIDAAPNCKLIIRGGVGVDSIDVEHAQSKNIIVRNTPKASSIAVAELSFALMIAVPNQLIKSHNSMKDGQWLKKEIKRTELFGKTLCMIGIGNIGSEVAKRAQAFGMKVVAYNRSKKPNQYAEVMQDLVSAVKDADYVSLNVPLTKETENIINKDLISKMKDGVVIINTARAKCVVTNDLVEALKSGKVSCYATDVWPNDPPAPDYAILHAPNVIMAPHIGANSKENLLRIGEEVVAIIDELKKEKKL